MSEAVESLMAQLAERAASLPGAAHAPLCAMRQYALSHLGEAGLPSPRHEDWKYTNVRPIERRPYTLAAVPDKGALLGKIESVGTDDSCMLLFLDGHLVEIRGTVPDGLTLESLAASLERDPAGTGALLGTLAPFDSNGFAALNAAALSDGAVLRVADGVEVSAPVELVFVASATEQSAALPRNLLVLGKNARAGVIERHVAVADNLYLSNSVTEVMLGDGSRLEHTTLQEQSTKAFHIAALEASISAGAEYVSNVLSTGAALARHDINVRFTGEGAACTLNGLYLGRARQHVDFHTRTYHDVPHCTSRQYYKGILDGSSRGVFNGQVHVAKDAQKSDAEQANHNLLLSRNAEIDTKPQLEIYADDVRCAHGTTVGQLDDMMLFYLRSRGIPLPQARGLLTFGFAHDLVERLPVEALREHMEHVLVELLPYGDQLKELV